MPYASIQHSQTRPLRLYYEVHGDAQSTPLLLIRGFTRSLRFWGELTERLAERRRVVVFDNRGVGRSDAPLGSYSVPQMAHDAAALLDHLGMERAHVFGMSMGGMIAQELALLHRDRVARLILGASSPGGRQAARLPKEQIMKLARSITLPRRQAVELSARMTLSARYLERHPEVIDTWEGYLSQDRPRKRGMLGQAAAVLRHDCWERLPHLRAQTLVLVGDADALVPPQNSHLLAERIPQAKLRILKGAGHDLTTEAPSKCALYILDFLERG